LNTAWSQLDPLFQDIFLNFIGFFEECIHLTNPDQHYYFEKQDGDIYFCTQIPFPLMNGIVSFSLNPQEVDAKCKAVLNRFKTSACPITWYWPHAMDIPQEIQAVFDKHGFQSMGQYLSVAVDSHTIKSNKITLEDDLSIQLVETEKDFADFIQITEEVYGVPQAAKQSMARLYSAYQYTKNMRLYLALVEDKPVSTLASYQKNHILGLYNGATLEAYRKRGLLTNLTIHAVQEAPEVDYVVAQLMSSQNAKGVVDQFGAEVYAHFTPLCAGFNLDEMKA
jgi:hypothetical protein